MVNKTELIISEITILQKIHHPNCTGLRDFFESDNHLYLITEEARGGELFDRIIAKGYFYEKDAAQLVRQIVKAMAYIHGLGIVHRDLKPENILFKSKEDDSEILITDFGLSKALTSPEDYLKTACGTPGYVSPEILRGEKYGKPTDMWAVGVIAYVILRWVDTILSFIYSAQSVIESMI